MVPPSSMHFPFRRRVRSSCGCQCWAVLFAQVARTTAVPETRDALPGLAGRDSGGRAEPVLVRRLVELAQGSITGRVPLAALAAGTSRHLPDRGLTSWASVACCQSCCAVPGVARLKHELGTV